MKIFEPFICQAEDLAFFWLGYYKKVDELLGPLNEYLRKLNVTYDIVGIIDPTEVKPIWEKLLKEWLKEGE